MCVVAPSDQAGVSDFRAAGIHQETEHQLPGLRWVSDPAPGSTGSTGSHTHPYTHTRARSQHDSLNTIDQLICGIY